MYVQLSLTSDSLEGTLVLGTHGSVSYSVTLLWTILLKKKLQVVGPGGQSVFLDGDGPILVYREYLKV